jgi:hypothetical protein
VTGAEFSEVDIDLLADYVGGALDGTPEQAVVAALIADDPAWRVAFDELSGGMAAVRAQLHSYGAVLEPMPADVAERLDAALASAVADPAPILASLAAPSTPRTVMSGDGGASVRPLRGVPNHGSRRRRARWAVPLAAAAGLLAFVGFGLDYVTGPGSSDQSAKSAAAGGGEVFAQSGSAESDASRTGPEIIHSGIDYQAGSLGAMHPMAAAGASSTPRQFVPGPTDEADKAEAPLAPGSPLVRLEDRSALHQCLDAIAQADASGGFSADTVDYASYEGLPAVVVRFTAADGSWVWASGAGCGTPGVGAGKLAAVKVG